MASRRARPPQPLDGILTPDGRYIVVRHRLWRAANPNLPAAERHRLTRVLMSARRDVGLGRRTGDAAAVAHARARVDRAKRALGERGPVWWDDGSRDHNRRLVHNTPYGEWFERLLGIADSLTHALDTRPKGGSICPSEVARAYDPASWRRHMDDVRHVARHLARRNLIVVTQRGRTVDPDEPFKGPIRLTRSREPG